MPVLYRYQTAASFNIGIIVDGFYVRDASIENVVVTVARPDGDFISGGGYFINESSAGTYPGGDGLRTNVGFNISFNKKLTNLRGHFNGIVRQSDGTVLQIKSNASESLVVNPTAGSNGGATFVSKANLTDVTDHDNPVGIAGNLTLIVSVTDNGESENSDTIGFTLWKRSELLFSSHWDGSQTLEQLLNGGNIAVHTSAQEDELAEAIVRPQFAMAADETVEVVAASDAESRSEVRRVRQHRRATSEVFTSVGRRERRSRSALRRLQAVAVDQMFDGEASDTTVVRRGVYARRSRR